MATYLPMAKGVLIFPRQREKLCAWLTHSTYAFCRTNYPDLLTKPPEARITENSLRNTWDSAQNSPGHQRCHELASPSTGAFD